MTPKQTPWTVFPRAAAIMAGLLLAVLVCGLVAPADAATGRLRTRSGSSDGSGGGSSSSDVVQIDPVPRFTESEVSALIEKPSVTFSVDNPRITSGGEATLSWQVENADTVNISGIGNAGLSGTRTVKPTEKTTYTLTATNRNGTVTKSVTVDITTLAVVGTIHTGMIRGAILARENVHFNFADEAKGATWASSVPLTFGAAEGANGWARVIASVRAEDDTDYEKVLQVAPENREGGFIYGEYVVEMPPNAKFRATLGFTRGHGTSDGATVSLEVRGRPRARGMAPPWKPVLTQKIALDDKLDAVEADLSGLADQKVSLRLVVNGGSQSADDLVLWIAPRIVK